MEEVVGVSTTVTFAALFATGVDAHLFCRVSIQKCSCQYLAYYFWFLKSV